MTNDYSNEWIYYSFIPTHDHRDADAVHFFLPSFRMHDQHVVTQSFTSVHEDGSTTCMVWWDGKWGRGRREGRTWRTGFCGEH